MSWNRKRHGEEVTSSHLRKLDCSSRVKGNEAVIKKKSNSMRAEIEVAAKIGVQVVVTKLCNYQNAS